MNKIAEIINKKPLLFLLVSLSYLFVLGFLKWRLAPTIEALWFVIGGVLGIYFLDGADVFFPLISLAISFDCVCRSIRGREFVCRNVIRQYAGKRACVVSLSFADSLAGWGSGTGAT